MAIKFYAKFSQFKLVRTQIVIKPLFSTSPVGMTAYLKQAYK